VLASAASKAPAVRVVLVDSLDADGALAAFMEDVNVLVVVRAQTAGATARRVSYFRNLIAARLPL
jgi:hypothetical protein